MFSTFHLMYWTIYLSIGKSHLQVNSSSFSLQPETSFLKTLFTCTGPLKPSQLSQLDSQEGSLTPSSPLWDKYKVNQRRNARKYIAAALSIQQNNGFNFSSFEIALYSYMHHLMYKPKNDFSNFSSTQSHKINANFAPARISSNWQGKPQNFDNKICSTNLFDRML